jgi:DnaA family protein
LFTVLNHCRLQGGALLLAAQPAPAGAGFALPDLASRAAGAIVYRLAELDETGRVEALLRQARLRGLELDSTAAQFLLNRVQRGMPELCAWLDRLDRASLAAQRKLTIPFIRRMLSAGIPE